MYGFSDDPTFSRHSKLLHSLLTRGRHTSSLTIVSTQNFTAVAQAIRVNATCLCVGTTRILPPSPTDTAIESITKR